MSIQKPRPSSLPMLEVCPRWVARPNDPDANDGFAEAAAEGTLVHEFMERLVENPVLEWDGIIDAYNVSDDLKTMVRECADQVRDLFMLGASVVTKDPNKPKYRYLKKELEGDIEPFSIFTEVSVEPSVCSAGTADLVAIFNTRAVLVDYKTVRVERDHDAQMFAYVIGIFESCPTVNSVEVRIVAPRLRDTHTPTVFDREKDLPKIVNTVSRIVRDHADPFVPGNPHYGCALCAGNGRCPYQVASLREVPSMVAPEMWNSILVPASADIRGQRRLLIKWLETFITAVKEDDKQWDLDHKDEELPGFTKVRSKGRKSLKTDMLKDFNQNVMARFGLPFDMFLSAVAPKKEILMDMIVISHGLTKKDAEAEYEKIVDKYSDRGEDIVSFRQVKTKETIGTKNTGFLAQ